jgi:SAM-dependent MidA family methyltransferase
MSRQQVIGEPTADESRKQRVAAIRSLLRAEIAQAGSIGFDRFMELALYHPQHGYYCQPKPPIGKHGDFFTASQVQPVFGRLMKRYCERLLADFMPGLPQHLCELGPGHGEMRDAFKGWQYRACLAGEQPELHDFHGVIFANEVFDALPVRVARIQHKQAFEQRVAFHEDAFCWSDAQAPCPLLSDYARRFQVPSEETLVFEAHEQGLQLLATLLRQVRRGLLVFIDYGYTTREWKRFPEGTLMSYRHHQASPDVLAEPGSYDITSHVPFTVLMAEAEAAGARVLRFERLAQALLFAGEADHFASALDAQEPRHRMLLQQQLKLLLYGMGESFRVLVIGSGYGQR